MTPLRERAAWRALEAHAPSVVELHLRELFARDHGRGERLVAEAAGLTLDYSKQRITDETLRLLVALAGESGVPERTEAMFRGERINTTENRAVLHVALRAPRSESIVVDVSGLTRVATYPVAAPPYPNHPITDRFGLITMFPMARAILPAEGAPADRTAQPFVQTTPRAWGEVNMATLQGENTDALSP